jgi:hypothetical protein
MNQTERDFLRDQAIYRVMSSHDPEEMRRIVDGFIARISERDHTALFRAIRQSK